MQRQNDYAEAVNMVSPDTIFKHTALSREPGSIRLIRILPEHSTDGFVQCEIQHSNITEDYRCLSYVWGDENDLQIVLVNEGKFTCRSNLAHSLKAAQKNKSLAGESFWIDAICINQQDVEERNQQVSQMGFIYSQASSVLAWLGPSEDLTHFFAFINRIAPLISDSKTAKGAWYNNQSNRLRDCGHNFGRTPTGNALGSRKRFS